jgi:hypothetical protein
MHSIALRLPTRDTRTQPPVGSKTQAKTDRIATIYLLHFGGKLTKFAFVSPY